MWSLNYFRRRQLFRSQNRALRLFLRESLALLRLYDADVALALLFTTIGILIFLDYWLGLFTGRDIPVAAGEKIIHNPLARKTPVYALGCGRRMKASVVGLEFKVSDICHDHPKIIELASVLYCLIGLLGWPWRQLIAQERYLAQNGSTRRQCPRP